MNKRDRERIEEEFDIPELVAVADAIIAQPYFQGYTIRAGEALSIAAQVVQNRQLRRIANYLEPER